MRREQHFQIRDTCPTVFQPGDREEDGKGEGGMVTKEKKGSRDREEGGRVGDREGTYKKVCMKATPPYHTHLPTPTLKYLPH